MQEAKPFEGRIGHPETLNWVADQAAMVAGFVDGCEMYPHSRSVVQGEDVMAAIHRAHNAVIWLPQMAGHLVKRKSCGDC